MGGNLWYNTYFFEVFQTIQGLMISFSDGKGSSSLPKVADSCQQTFGWTTQSPVSALLVKDPNTLFS